ncbi:MULTISPECIES: hypothetical protein [Actinomadura]|uniref:hypothetical protein n=1 Tax=Actinomadura TaxID=1988 RepID=UPI000402216C|nr:MULTISPECIES: hypothetical protein [Actinomadura]RSN68158.1 hypothetical protein DMH08_11420 [Actinomadura sp. WAC 06369]
MSDPYLTEIGWTGSALRLAGRLEHRGTPRLELLLRERGGEAVVRVPATARTDGPHVAFEARIDVAAVAGGAPLPGGVWDAGLSVDSADAVPLARAPGLDASPQRGFLDGGTTVAAYISPLGTLAIDVGGRTHPAGSVRADGLRWDERTEHVEVSGRLDVAGLATPISATLHLRERRGRAYEVICMLDDRPEGLHYTAVLPVTRTFIDEPLPRGTWEVWLRLGFSGMHRELRVLAPAEPVDVRVWRRLWHVRIASTAAPDPLTITVGRA